VTDLERVDSAYPQVDLLTHTTLLQYDIRRPAENADGGTVAVLLHGRGSHRGDLQALHPALPESWALITPQAPYPGHPWGYGSGWAWYRYVEDDRVMEDTLTQSLASLHAFLLEVPRIVGFQPGRIVLGGFSQGGTMSMAYALTRPGKIMAALNFSGFIPASLEVPFSAMSPGTAPIFWGHGLRDPAIPFELAVRGRAKFDAASVQYHAADYDIGHWIVPEEVRDAVDFVESL
jgi:phospholipase/carboxylesterase